MNNSKSRRVFIKTSAASLFLPGALMGSCKNVSMEDAIDYSALDRILKRPVLKRDLFSGPVIIEYLELLHFDGNFICKVRAENGAIGLSVSNSRMTSLYPIFIHQLRPFFIGRDARNLDDLLDEVYVHKLNYKYQGIALWIPLATIEFAILDMLGRIAGTPMCQLLGDQHHSKIAVYRANNNRGLSAKESLETILTTVQESGARALKFKVGGRMSRNRDYPPGRTEELIPLLRKEFGNEMTIYADSNGSYDVPEAVRIGKILQRYNIDFFEEPVPFDWYEETREVKQQLDIPVAGGEQEPSMHNFRWLIANDGLDIVQPDIFYFGGMIRSLKVARMAETMGKLCTPHISGSGLGYLYMMQFVSILPNAGPYHEFKGFNPKIPLNCDTSDLTVQNGKVSVPSGPGSGIEIDTNYMKRYKLVTT
ncbi:MAG: mandelate racemase/muconate lactonizing enzyme family protein [Bacteroidales bacterium]